MQKLQDSVFSIVKTTNLASSVFSYLQPTEESQDITPQGGILNDTKHGWLALGTKFCVVDLRTGLKIAAKTFGPLCLSVTSVVELPTPLANNTQQLVISLECEDNTGLICIFHMNGSQTLRCIKTGTVVTQLSVCDGLPAGPLACFDGTVIAGSKHGEIFLFDLNRAILIQAFKDICQGYEHLVKGENDTASLTFMPLHTLDQIEEQRDLVIENNAHIAILLNENSLIDGQYIFRNPDGTVRMKAKKDHIWVTVLQYIPQLGSLAVGFNFGAFQIWSLINVDLEFTSQVSVECLPVTQFGFQEPCDDPRAFCYLWVIFSVSDRLEEEEFPLAVMYSLTYLGKRMLSDTQCLYQEFSTATIRFQLELSPLEDAKHFIGGRCISCHTYSVDSTMGAEGEESFLNLCQMVWECWGDNPKSPPCYGMLLFDLDQWYKDQMPATYQLETNTFMSTMWCSQLSIGSYNLDIRIAVGTISPYCHANRQDAHLCPNSLSYECICLNTSEVITIQTTGVQCHLISCLESVGPTALINPTGLFLSCISAGLTPQASEVIETTCRPEEQRKYLLSVALEARLSRFLKRCAHDWATGTHNGAGCTLNFLVDWSWLRAVELKKYAKELSTPLFVSSALPDRNVVRCLEHCVQQLTQITSLLDSVLTTCCNLVVPTALSEIEEKYKGIGTVSLYFQVVQWFLRVGLLPERRESRMALPYPASQLYDIYVKRRLKLQRLQEQTSTLEPAQSDSKGCSLLYIDQLVEHEFGSDRIQQMWIRGGSECEGLYPPPSLYSLLRLYLLPDIAEEHKHSLVLYLLIDYCKVYEDVRYESVIRRLMQFPTMFGLSNTAIKATQAFWHLDHRDFDFALDQLQCLTGNTLSDWQHHVVLSSLLAQKKSQAALQYLHVRKPAPIRSTANNENQNSSSVNDHDKLDDWQACSNLYLARGLVYEALDVVRMCVSNYSMVEDKIDVLEYFFKCCRNTGQLAKLLQIVFLPFEEELFIKYLQKCNEPQTSDILVMYYLQQARYIEAEQYNNKLKQMRLKHKDLASSNESILDGLDRENARDLIVETYCSAIPSIANSVARLVMSDKFTDTRVLTPKPMSVFIQAKSPKNTYTYKSSFIQDTIENASETWINKPKMRKGLKRALNIEDTPFICTPIASRKKSIFSNQATESTPSKRARLDLTNTPKASKVRPSDNMSEQMKSLLDMPEVQSPDCKAYLERSGTATPQSILKIRRYEDYGREGSPVDSRYLGNSDDEVETASNHTHYSDSKHLRFTIPTESESGSSPSIPDDTNHESVIKMTPTHERQRDIDVSFDNYVTTASHPMSESHPLESPPKKLATEEKIKARKSYKDTVRGRRSLSISANSSVSEDPNTSVESIADIPITLINPRYSGERRRSQEKSFEMTLSYVGERGTETPFEERRQHVSHNVVQKTLCYVGEKATETPFEERRQHELLNVVQKTPKGRRSIRDLGEGASVQRSRSVTPDRQDSPVVTPMHSTRATRSRSRTPDISPRVSPLAPILEQPKQETESEPHATKTLFSTTRQLRSRSRTPERVEKSIKESSKLEVISESPIKGTEAASPVKSPSRSLRSRSRTPDMEIIEDAPKSPRSLRNRAKTPEKIMSPKFDHSTKIKKPLSRIVLEANAFAKTKQNFEKLEEATSENDPKNVLECTPKKTLKQTPSLMDVTISPIVNKTLLHSSIESVATPQDKENKTDEENASLRSIPAFTINDDTYYGKSVLHSYQSSIADTSESIQEETKNTNPVNDSINELNVKSLPAFTTINQTDADKSVLHSYQSSVAETSTTIREETTEPEIKTNETHKSFVSFKAFNESDVHAPVLESCNTTVADTSEDQSKNYDKEMSGLMTSDSEIEAREDKQNVEDTAKNIQKEKEKIVEIDREINEIEGDMSHDSEGCTDEEIVVDGENEIENEEHEESENADGSNDESDEEEETSHNEDETSHNEDESVASENDEEDSVISINDSDSDSSSNKLQIDDNSATNDQPDEISEAEIQIEDISNETQIQNVDVPTDQPIDVCKDVEMSTEPSEDPLNQGQFSLLTDDNSAMESDNSDINLNYSDENAKGDKLEDADVKSGLKCDIAMETEADMTEKVDNSSEKPKEKVFSMIEKPTSCDLEKDNDKSIDNVQETVEMIIEPINKGLEGLAKPVETYTKEVEKESVPKFVEEQSINIEPEEKVFSMIEKPPSCDQEKDHEKTVDKVKKPEKMEYESINKELDASPDSAKTLSKEETKETAPKLDEPSKTAQEDDEMCDKQEKAIETTPPKPRKRTSSNSSNKSVIESQSELLEEKAETKTPMTRKRVISMSSTQSISEEKTPEHKGPDTPSQRRAKTPTSTEVRRILTRRASKELSEKLDDSKLNLDASISTEPTAHTSKSSSIASDSSIRSSKSKASEEGDRPAAIRKGRKSILNTKPDLSVIPEMTIEDASREESKDIISEITSSRRLTRNQKAVLESWLEPNASPRRRTISKSEAVQEDNDGFEGWPESETKDSPDSLASENIQKISRLVRAASETKTTPKVAAKISRRMSVDITLTPEALDSPSRGRRASFTRAIEALHTPKGRRTSTDLKKGETDSQLGSPIPEEVTTPSRRGRKASVKTESQKSETDSIRSSPIPEETATPSRRGRKASTQKSETESIRSSPVPEEIVTPARRGRKPSTQKSETESIRSSPVPEEIVTPARRGKKPSTQKTSPTSEEVATPSRRGRKASTQKSETDSVRSSPVPEEIVTPARRGRRASKVDAQMRETDSMRGSPAPEQPATPSRRARRASAQTETEMKSNKAEGDKDKKK